LQQDIALGKLNIALGKLNIALGKLNIALGQLDIALGKLFIELDNTVMVRTEKILVQYLRDTGRDAVCVSFYPV
jgi:hypothetical protein